MWQNKSQPIQDTHKVKEARTWMWERMTATLAFQRNDKVQFKWQNFHLFQFSFDCPKILFVGTQNFSSVKNKSKNLTPWRLLSRECFCNSRRNHICSEEPEDCILLVSKRTDFVSRSPLWKYGPGGWFRAAQQPSQQAAISYSQENKHKWYKNTQRRWLWVVCPRKTNTAWPARKMADSKTR